MPYPSFTLKNLPVLPSSADASEKPAPGHRQGNARTDPTQPCEIGDARIAEWARDSGRCLEAAAFGECLDGRQVEDELSYAWMHREGWQPEIPPTRLDMLATLTWRRGNVVATDVRPENAILADADGEIYPFDFILSEGMPCDR